jgi:hypothetical protein
MARLTSPSGVTVDVSDEKAETLRQIGYKAEAKSEPKAPAKKSASGKSSRN